jgi:UDP-3-O-[3-hydroxymyristoyl] glucosamine N-acyltransferase
MTAGQVAALVGGELLGEAGVRLSGIAPLDRAGPADLSFLTNGRYMDQFLASRAGAVLIVPEYRDTAGGPPVRIVVESPHKSMIKVVKAAYPDPPRPRGIEPTAIIDKGALLGDDVYLGPYVIVGPGARIGARTVVMAHSVIQGGATIGDDCTLYPQVVLYPRAVVGNRVTLHAGVRLASDGFGYVRTPAGHEKVPHIGRTIIEDDVEIGANTTIDRGSISDTTIGAGSKVDNLVHIGHNVRIGKRAIIMALVGIAGSTVVEDDVILAGQAGLCGHMTIGAGSRVLAQAGVIGDVPPGATYSGFPAREHRDVLRETAALRRLTPLARELESKLNRERDEAR